MDAIQDEDLLIAVITVTILFFLFSAFTVLYFFTNRRRQKLQQQQIEQSKKEYEQQFLQAQVEVQEGTYRHIAKELHDNVGQLLSTTKMLMGVTELKLGYVPDSLLTANITLSKAIQELRLLSRSLDKEWLEQFDFIENLQNEVAHINAAEKVKAVILGDTLPPMKPEEQIILFRIVQEAIQNAIRHADPGCLNIQIQHDGVLDVKVINDGKQLPAEFHGMGTNNMQQRAKLFGGKVSWESVEAKTVVTISLPINGRHEN